MKLIPSDIVVKANAVDGLEITEFGADRVLCVTKAKVKAGLLLFLDGALGIGGQEFPFEATGKVLSVSASENGFARVEIHLHQYDRELWGRFLQASEKAQGRVDALLKSMKGEG